MEGKSNIIQKIAKELCDSCTVPRTLSRVLQWLMLATIFLAASGCSFDRTSATRTPFPTWTPSPVGQQAADAAPVGEDPTPTPAPVVQLPTDTPVAPPPTPEPETPLPTDTTAPEVAPPEAPTEVPTATLAPEPTATAAFAFTLEAAEKFPTDSLAANVVRIYLYAYEPTTLGLPGYTLQVLHNGAALTVDEESTAGAPEQTRTVPSPYTRFTNMSVVFVEPQAGRWEIQLVDSSRAPVGPLVAFDLTADEVTRELYVRYRQE